MKKLVKPSVMDTKNSVDLFDADLTNELGDMLCIAPAILPEQADEYWKYYAKKSSVAM